MEPSPNQSTAIYGDDEVDLFALWDILAAKWRWIVTSTVVSILIGVTIALTMTPIYRAEALIVGAEEGKGGGGLSSLAGQLGGLGDLAGISVGGGARNEAIATLKSRKIISAFIEEKTLKPLLYEKQWDANKKAWKSDDPQKIPTDNEAVDFFTKEVLKVEEDKKAGYVKVAIEWKDRELAATWANEIVKRTNDEMRDRAIVEAQAGIEYLNKELQHTSVVEIQQAIYRLLEVNLKTISIAKARSQYAFKVIDPAVAPDLKKRERPKRRVIVLIAALCGAFGGVFGVFANHGYRKLKAQHVARLKHENYRE